jgi:hypothetical protein
MHIVRVNSAVGVGCAVPSPKKSRVRGKADGVGFVEDFSRRVEPNTYDGDIR